MRSAGSWTWTVDPIICTVNHVGANPVPVIRPTGLPTELTVSTVWSMTQALRPVGGPSQIEENVRQVTRMLMKRDGVTLPELALRLGVSRTAVSNRLGGPSPYSGKKPFTLTEVAMLEEMFGTPAAAFLAGPTALISSSAGQDDLAPGSIKNRRRLPGVSRDVAGARLSLVAA